MSKTVRRIAWVLILLLALLIVASRYFHLALTPTASSPSKDFQSDRLRIGTLTLMPCEIGRRGTGGVGTADAYCTNFDVPEDWDAPAGRHIQLHVAIVKSTAAHSQSDLVAYLAGGPGGAATEEYPALAAAFAPLTQRRNILLIDQRGTGASNALSCAPPADESQNIAESIAQSIIDSRQLIEHCLSKVREHASPQYYTTTDAIRDLEKVRQALGSPQLDLYGVSYGTRVAQQYAGRYPASVRSVVLDSVIPNSLALGSEHARNLEQALRALFAVCTADELLQK